MHETLVTAREQTVWISSDKMICALLAAAGLSFAAAESRADLLDFLRPKRAAVISRAQSPEGRSFGAGTYSPRNLWQPQPSGKNQTAPNTSAAGTTGAGVQNGWGYDAAPGGNYAASDFSGGAPEINCGECDRHQGRVSFCRKLCHQTYYPRSAPYCMPDWGWNQTCWRRMNDNYNCPRPDSHASCPDPRLPLPPQTPVVPPATSYLPSPHSPSNRAVSYGQRQPFQGQSQVRGRADSTETPESENETGDWNYEEEPEGPQFATPPRANVRANYYPPPAGRR